MKKQDVTEKYAYRLDKSQDAALRGIVAVAKDVVRDMATGREQPPEPLSTRSYSGQFRVRIPPRVHRQLALEAAEENVSLNRLVAAKLTHG